MILRMGLDSGTLLPEIYTLSFFEIPLSRCILCDYFLKSTLRVFPNDSIISRTMCSSSLHIFKHLFFLMPINISAHDKVLYGVT